MWPTQRMLLTELTKRAVMLLHMYRHHMLYKTHALHTGQDTQRILWKHTNTHTHNSDLDSTAVTHKLMNGSITYTGQDTHSHTHTQALLSH